jgi:hypothetical protein
VDKVKGSEYFPKALYVRIALFPHFGYGIGLQVSHPNVIGKESSHTGLAMFIKWSNHCCLTVIVEQYGAPW